MTTSTTREIRFLRPEGENFGVYIGGSESWYRCGTVLPENGQFRARFRDCNPGDLGLFATPQDAARAMREARREEGRILNAQIDYERANGWSTD